MNALVLRWRAVQARLLPPSPILRFAESLLERFCWRQLSMPQMIPQPRLRLDSGRRTIYIDDTGGEAFRIVFAADPSAKLLFFEAHIRVFAGEQSARLVCKGSADPSERLEIPLVANRRGSIRTVWKMPADVGAVYLQLASGPCRFELSELAVHEIGKLEATCRMLERLGTYRQLSSLRRWSGLRSFQGILSRYQSFEMARLAKSDEDSYLRYMAAVEPAVHAANVAAAHKKRTGEHAFFLICISSAGIAADVSLHRTLTSIRSQPMTNYQIRVDDRLLESGGRTPDSCRSHWCLFLVAGDIVREACFDLFSASIGERTQVIYSDHDAIDAEGQRSQPQFKPDWDQDLFLSLDYLGRTAAYRLPAGFDFDAAEVYAAAIAAAESVIDEILADETGGLVSHVAQILFSCFRTQVDGPPPLMTNSALGYSVDCYLQSRGVRQYRAGAIRDLDWPVPEPTPEVLIIIPSRDNHEMLQRCVDSIHARTAYSAWRIVVINNQSTARATLSYLSGFAAGDPRHQVIDYQAEFNYSAINNLAVRSATAPLLLFLNDDTEVCRDDWLERLVAQVSRPGVAAVGAKLLYPDRTIQHGGVTLGVGGIAGHSYRFAPETALGNSCRLQVVHQAMAVTGACLLVTRAAFERVGGFDEQVFKVAFNDVDLCLRLRQAGFRVLLEPRAVLIHYESYSRGPDDTPRKREVYASESAAMMARWRRSLVNDPFYNPNLSLQAENHAPRVE